LGFKPKPFSLFGGDSMLTRDDLFGTNNISNINISDISLKLYKSFFDDILCTRLFIYNLEDNNKLKLSFQETHLLHILGAQHILGEKYKASKFNDKINDDKMTFELLEAKNNIVFNDFTDRFLSFSNLYHLLTNCSLIYFDKDTYKKTKSSKEESQMDFTHILYTDLESKKIHAGLDTFNKGHSFYCKSLLVTSTKNDKIICDQTPIPISSIEVLDKKTNKVLYIKNLGEDNPPKAVGQNE
jgi:hypothetical protein